MSMERQISQRQKVRNISERMDAVEAEFPRIIAAVSEALNSQQQQVAQLGPILEALVELLGSSTVDAKIKEMTERKNAQRLAEAVKRVEEGIANGDLVPTTEINEKTLVIGVETDKDGVVLPPGRAQLMFAGILPEFQEQLKGKGPGATVDVPSGGKFTVTEAYSVVVKAAPAATDVADAPTPTPPTEAPAVSTPVEA